LADAALLPGRGCFGSFYLGAVEPAVGTERLYRAVSGILREQLPPAAIEVVLDGLPLRLGLMARGKFVGYLRVSTEKQSQSVLGIGDRIRQAVRSPRTGEGAGPCEGDWCHLGHRQTRQALAQGEPAEVHVLAAVAEHERETISQRTTAALAAAKARGVKLGNPNGARALRGLGNAHAVAVVKAGADARTSRVLPVIDAIRRAGTTSLHGIAMELNRRGILTARGGQWYATTVKNLLDRAAC